MDELVEPSPVADIYADGIATVEPLSGDNIRVTYFVYQRGQDGTPMQRIVCARIIRPRSSLINGQVQAMLGDQPKVQTSRMG